MAFTHKEGRGNMFKNTRRTSETQPEWRGDFMGLDGTVYDIAMWWSKDKEGNVKKDKDGNTIMSLKVSHKRPQEAKEEAPAEKDDDLGVPF